MLDADVVMLGHCFPRRLVGVVREDAWVRRMLTGAIGGAESLVGRQSSEV